MGESALNLSSGFRCAACRERIDLCDEIFELQAAHGYLEGGNAVCFPATTEDGEYQYKPRFICFSCWEDIEEALECGNPIEDQDDDVFSCDYCNSDIEDDELIGVGRVGEMHRSRRLGNVVFETISTSMRVLCCDCLTALGERLND